jgi:ketosteroid isomerase-like protein
MRKIFLVSSMLIAASLLLVSCGDPGAGNAGNRTANAGNTANNAAATAPANTAAIESDLKKMTTDMAASLVKDDIAAMEKVYGENYTFVGPDGSVATRAQRIDAMKSGDTKYETITYDDISVRTNPEGTGAIVISKATVKGKNMGKPVDGLYRVTHVWSKMKDGWRMVNGQTTPITAAAAPAKADDLKAADANKAANGAKPPSPPANK